MKACSVCGEDKRPIEFQGRLASVDGLTAACKLCLHERDRKRYPKEKVRRGRWLKLYVQTESGKASVKKSKRKWLMNNANKRAAHILLGNAIRDRKIKKPKICDECRKKKRLHGHHDDYAKPLEVRWLCPRCHTDWHKEGKT